MGKKSTKTDKSVYFQAREEAGLTRARASELLKYITESRLEKIETEKTTVQPEDVVAMAAAYKKPSLCNYYCANQCRIGKESVPEIKLSGLPEIVLGTLACLNSLEDDKNRLIEITADSNISDDELEDFIKIQIQLEKISITADALKLWIDNKIVSGEIDKNKIQSIKKRYS